MSKAISIPEPDEVSRVMRALGSRGGQRKRDRMSVEERREMSRRLHEAKRVKRGVVAS